MRRKMRRCESREKSSSSELFQRLGVCGIVQQDGAKDGFFGIEFAGNTESKARLGMVAMTSSVAGRGRKRLVHPAQKCGNPEDEPNRHKCEGLRRYRRAFNQLQRTNQPTPPQSAQVWIPKPVVGDEEVAEDGKNEAC